MGSATARYRKIFVFALLVFILISSVTSASAANKQFTDVSQRYMESVDYLAANGLANGINDTQFGVSKQIKRGDAAIILAKALGLAIDEAPASGFTDVPTRGVGAINALKHAGVVNGKSATNFGFNDLLKRGEIALMLAKSSAYNLQGNVENLTFTDVNARYQEAVAALVEYNITSGKSATRFGTNDNITRGEYAIFIHRAEMIDPYVPIETGVAVDKVWEFPFDAALAQATLTQANIRVLDAEGKDVPVQRTVTDNGKTLVINPPQGNYQKGESYEIHISTNVTYTNGNPIEKPIRFDFITERDEVETGTVNPEIIVVEQEYVEEQSGVEIVIDKSVEEELKTEDIIIVPSAEFPEGQAHKITTLKEDSASYTVTVEKPDFSELYDELDIYKTFEIKPEHIEIDEQLDGVILADPETARTAAATEKYSSTINKDGLKFIFENVSIGGGEEDDKEEEEKEEILLNGVLNIAKPEFETDLKLGFFGKIKRYQVIYNNSTTLDMDVVFPALEAGGEKTMYDKELKKKLTKKQEKIKLAKAKVPTQVPGLYIQGQFFLEVKYDFSYQPVITVEFQLDESKGVIYDGKKVRPVYEITPGLDISYLGSGKLEASAGAVANIGVTAYGVVGVGVEGFAGAKGSLEFFNGLNELWGAYACYNAGFSPVLEGRIFADILGSQVYNKTLVEKKFAPNLAFDNCQVFQELNSVNEVQLDSGKSQELAVKSLYVNLGSSETELKSIKNFADLTVESSDENTVQVSKANGKIILTASNQPAKEKATIIVNYTEKEALFEKPVTSTIEIPVIISDFLELDLNGEWSRSNGFDDATLNITNATKEEFDFEIITQRSFGTGYNDVEGTAEISGNTALFKEGDGIFGCEIQFQLAEEAIEIENDCVAYTGNSTTFDGVFKKGPLTSIGLDPADREYFHIASAITDQYGPALGEVSRTYGYFHTQNPAEPEMVEPFLSPFSTSSFLDENLSLFAEIISCECDAFVLPTVNEMMLRVDIEKVDDETFSLSGLYLLTEFGGYWPVIESYQFKKEEGTWKLNDWDIQQVELGSADFNLSLNEVARIYSIHGMRFKFTDEYTVPSGETFYRLTSYAGEVIHVSKRTGELLY